MSAAPARDWMIALAEWCLGRFGHTARAGTSLRVAGRTRGALVVGPAGPAVTVLCVDWISSFRTRIRARDWMIALAVWRLGRFGHAAWAGTIRRFAGRMRGALVVGQAAGGPCGKKTPRRLDFKFQDWDKSAARV